MEAAGPADSVSPIRRILDISFLVLIGSLGFLQIPFNLFGFSLVATDVVFLLTGLLLLANLLIRKVKIVWQPIYWCFFAYLAALLCSALLSANVTESVKRFFEEAYLVCLSILVINVIDSSRLLRLSLFAWISGTSFAVVVGLLTIALFYFNPENTLLPYLTYHYGSVPVGNYPRVTATFVSASMFCNYLNVSLVIVLIANVTDALNKYFTTALLLGILIATAFTFSIGLGGIFLAFGGWIYMSRFDSSVVKKAALVFGGAVALFFLIISVFALTPYPNAEVWCKIPGTNLSLIPSARVLVWRDGFSTFIAHPINGIGLAQPVADVVFSNTEGSQSLLSDAHNTFLEVAAESGVLGFAAIVSIVIFILRAWWEKFLHRPASNTIAFGLGLAFLCGFVYHGMTGSFEHARHLWVLIGMFTAAVRVETDES